MGEITLSAKQILNLCEFVGIKIEVPESVFSEDPGQLETEYRIAQNEYGAVAWLDEYPEEGVYPLSGEPCILKGVGP